MFGGLFHGLHVMLIAILSRLFPLRYQDIKVKELPIHAKIVYFLLLGIIIILCEVLVTIIGGGFLLLVDKFVDVAWDTIFRK